MGGEQGQQRGCLGFEELSSVGDKGCVLHSCEAVNATLFKHKGRDMNLAPEVDVGCMFYWVLLFFLHPNNNHHNTNNNNNNKVVLADLLTFSQSLSSCFPVSPVFIAELNGQR